MKIKKLKKIVASAMVLSTLLSNSIVSAATTTSTSTSSPSSTSSSTTTDENVLKVNVSDSGSVTYSTPVSTSGAQDRPFSWNDASVYFVMTDRFYNGDTSNDHSYGRSTNEKDAANYASRQGTFHGGDLKGLTQKLDAGYFDDLGVNAIWITAPYEQIHGAMTAGGYKHYPYEGYWALDYTNVDANMGTATDLEKFIDTAHTHGIRVVFDVVINHSGYADPVTANEYGFGALSSNWKDVYYNTSETNYNWYNDYDVEAQKNGSSAYTMLYNGDWKTNWWGTDWVRAVGTRFSGYDGVEGNGITDCSSGLPDFKLDSDAEVGLPGILKVKWTKEGRLQTETDSLNAWFTKTGYKRTVQNYIVKWLTDYVRKYGVDGFRLDTAKNVPQSSIKALKTEGLKALKEWRTNNPTKPGAEWTDDFWMTGEVYDNGASATSDYYTNAKLDSLINFKFQDSAFSKTASLDGTYSNYANWFNSDSSQGSALSYISSHDKGLKRGDMITAGTNLLLCPSGIQIFYGDETNRQAVGASNDMSSRSQMNWDSIDTAVLKHWQILGQFRRNHLSVGAGTHNKISDSPYTFSRVYNKNGVSDSVVISLPGTSGSTTVSVGGVFADGSKVRDFYTGTMYTVSGGQVTVNAGSAGVILLEKGDNSPSISTSVGSTSGEYKYYADSQDVSLYVSSGATATYSINGGAATTYTNGQTITIGKDAKVGDKTTLTLNAKSSDGSIGPCTYTYVKGDPTETLTIHAKYTQFSGTPNIYLYSAGTPATQYDGAWPGKAMTSEGNGWYVSNCTATRTANVIFNGSFGQVPGAQQPGISVTGEVWILNGVVTNYNPERTTGTVNVKYVDQNGKEIATAVTKTGTIGTTYTTAATTISGYTLTATPANASGTFTSSDITVTYVYKAAVTIGTVKVNYVDESGNSIATSATKTGTVGTAYTTTAATVSGYTLKAVPANASGNFIDGTTTVNYVYTKIVAPTIIKTATSVVSPQVVGTSIKLTTTGTGTGTLNYRFIVTKDSKTVFSKSYGATNYTTWKPTEAGTYRIYYKLKDSTGQEVQKTISYVIKAPTTVTINSITPSVATQVAGKSVTISVNATNAVSYAYWINDASGEWTQLSAYSSSKTATWTPKTAGSYVIWVDAKDSTGKVVSKYIFYTVTAN